MLPSRKKIIISALFLALITSFALVSLEQMSTSADEEDDPRREVSTLDGLMAAIEVMEDGEECFITQKIFLPALSTNGELTIDGGKNGQIGCIVIKQGAEYGGIALFDFPADNKGTYIFKNLIIDANSTLGLTIKGDNSKVIFENVDFYGLPNSYLESNIDGSANIISSCDELTIIDCKFKQDYISYHIYIEKGKLTMVDSVIWGGSHASLSATTSEKISIENCYMNSWGSGYASIDIIGVDRVNLSIKDSTFMNGGNGMHSINISLRDGSEGNNIEIIGSLFTPPNEYYDGQAIIITGGGKGELKIEQCQFSDMLCNFYDSSSNPALIYLKTELSFLISDTTVYSNQVVYQALHDPDPGDPPQLNPYMLYIQGMDGKIINSTFAENTISGPTKIGCVYLEGCNVDLINNTFLNNYSASSGFSDAPANVQIALDTDARFINNILMCSGGSGSTILDLYEPLEVGNIDEASQPAVGELFDESWEGSGIYAGCDIDDAGYDILDISPDIGKPKQIMMFMILPFSDADGQGAAYMSAPTYDQRGKERLGDPDIGAVTIATAMFDANGGYFEGGVAYPATPYFYFDPNDNKYGRVGAVADPDGEIPFTLDNPDRDPFLFLGWSTNENAEYPDPMFVYGTEAVGEFDAATYYAVWGDGYIILFEPGNGLDPVIKDLIPDMAAPEFPVTNGMRLTKWTLDEGGMSVWDPAIIPFDGNGMVYGQWEAVKVTVTFDPLNGNRATTSEVVQGEPVTRPADPSKSGFRFTGWFTSAEGGTEWVFTSSVNQSMTLYAQWEAVQMYEVTFDPLNGDNPFTVDVMEGDRVSVPQAPTLLDHRFTGWFTSPERGMEWDFGLAIESDMTLYARWAEADAAEEVTIADDEVVIITVVVASVVASLGIVPAAVGGVAGIGPIGAANVLQQGIAGDVAGAETSGEEKNRRTVVFDPKNGRSPWVSSVFLGRLADRPADPRAPRGMRFSHWSESPDGPEFSFLTPITKVTHLYAVYVMIET